VENNIKLVRDFIHYQVNKEDKIRFTLIEPYPYDLLIDKMFEEAEEIKEEYENNMPDDSLLYELSDLLEVMIQIASTRDLTFLQILTAARDKRARKGGFKEGWVYIG